MCIYMWGFQSRTILRSNASTGRNWARNREKTKLRSRGVVVLGVEKGLSTYVDCECRVAIELVDKVCEKCEISVDKLVIVFQRGE